MIIVRSELPIPSGGGERFLRDCESLLNRSPLKANSHHYHVYVANGGWRQRLFFIPNPDAWGIAYSFAGSAFLSGADFDTGRVVHWRSVGPPYIGTPPRTLAYLCAHELTHVITWEHIGPASFRLPRWVFEGFADYVGIETRQSFDELWNALGDQPDNDIIRVKFGSYPRYRMMVTYFIEKEGWSVDQILQTRLTEEEAMQIIRAETNQ